MFKSKNESIDDIFLTIPVDEAAMTKFLLEVVVYDPHNISCRFAAGYHPSSHHSEDDIISFSKNVSDHFLDSFNIVWGNKKGKLP